MSIGVNELDQDIYVITLKDDVVYVTTNPNNYGQPSIQFQDEGANVGEAGVVNKIDFVGSNVSVSLVGGKLTITISGGSASYTAEDAANKSTTFFADRTSDIKYPSVKSVYDFILNKITGFTKTGRYLTPQVNASASGTIALAANSLRAYPFQVLNAITITELISEVTTLVALSKYRFGLYTDNGSIYPDALISGSDAVEYDSSATGTKSSGVVNIVVQPGLYWIAYNSNGTASLRSIPVSGILPVMGASAFSGSTVDCRYAVALAYGAMPSTFPAGGVFSANVSPYLLFKV
jgi:hypothetical protein